MKRGQNIKSEVGGTVLALMLVLGSAAQVQDLKLPFNGARRLGSVRYS